MTNPNPAPPTFVATAPAALEAEEAELEAAALAPLDVWVAELEAADAADESSEETEEAALPVVADEP
jgi:hypothetical protein